MGFTFLIIALGLQVLLRSPPLLSFTLFPFLSLSIFARFPPTPPFDIADLNIFSQSMEVTEGLKMQRQSFDFQLTELPISPALISHALPLRPTIRCADDLPFHSPLLARFTM